MAIECLTDSPLDQHVDMHQLRCAWSVLDADCMVDVAIDALVIEKRLRRKHRCGLDGESILLIAMEIATDRSLGGTVMRIREVASRFNLDSLIHACDESLQESNGDKISSEGLTVEESQQLERITYKIIGRRLRGDLQWHGGESGQAPPAVWDRLRGAGMDTEVKSCVLNAVMLLDRVLAEMPRLAGQPADKDRETISGEFDVPANARNGVLYRNWSNRRRGVCFEGAGSWTYHPRQGFHGPGGHARNTAGASYMLPGRPAGGLIALGVPETVGFQWIGAEELSVVMGPYAAFKFFCNDDYGGFGDNHGSVRIRWSECVWDPILG